MKPIYLIAGGPGMGRRKVRSLFEHVICDYGIHAPAVAYVGAASSDNAEFFKWLAGLLIKAGAGSVTLAPVTGGAPGKKKACKVLQDADIVFISGGDVEMGMKLLARAGLLPVLKRLFAGGVPFFGLSAGSIMLARNWVRWAEEDDSGPGETFPCLGFAPVLCDTHGEDDEWNELHALLNLSGDGTVGYGITAPAALRVDADGRVGAVGGEVFRFVAGKKAYSILPLNPEP